MGETEYEFQLDDAGLNWLRVRFTTRGRRVMSFVAQYETLVDNVRLAVVRYDNAHGFPHRDILNRSGRVIAKQAILNARTPNEALVIGERDIRENWQQYRASFLGDAS